MKIILFILIFSLINFLLYKLYYKKDKLISYILYPSYIYGLYVCQELNSLKTLYISTYDDPKNFIKVQIHFKKDYNYKNLSEAYCYNQDTLRRYDIHQIYKVKTDSSYFKIFVELLQKETNKENYNI